MKLTNLFLLLLTAIPGVQGSIICFFLGTPRCFLGLGAKMRQGKPGEEDCQETCGLIFLAILNFLTGYTCGGCGDLLTGQQPNDPNSFHIDVFGVDIPSSDAQAFINAADRWAEIIVDDSGHGPFTAEQIEDVRPADQILSGCVYPPEVDDLLICADVRSIDGPGDGDGNVLGAAAPVLFEVGKPVVGFMFFDEFDVGQLQQAGTYEDVILHEMGHVIGLGTAWITNGLQENSNDCPYFGANANAQYRSITGCSGNVLIEPGSSGPGSACSHWAENSCLRFELMSSGLSANSQLSAITVGSLEDIGYGVDYGQADNLQLSGSCCRRRLGEPEPPRRKLLSDEATAKAVAFGQELLASQPEFNPKGSSFTFSGIVNVLMLEDGEVFDVMVTAAGAV